ncbi:hypothetical protein ABT061_43400 [Streptosporangium sp. NPDC002544]|uniref:hypothetical protein n=1 Tax=Streptosporangium sp. NPDC002544 TaxID=3154538 RepID=UPI00331D2C49
MGSLTTWNRLEPRTRSATLPGLAARVADPLWMIGRQGQLGELTGSDTASPLAVHLRYEIAPITHWRPDIAQPGDAGLPRPEGTPIEALVDRVPEPVRPRDRAHGGRRLLTLLGPTLSDRYGAALRREFRLDSGDVLSGRAVDGAEVRAQLALVGPEEVRARLDVTTNDAGGFDAAAEAFATWWDRHHPTAVGAWQPRRLAAPFTVGAGDMTLGAPDHRGGRVDWYTFDVIEGTLAAGGPPPVEGGLTVLPTQLSFPGMPFARWWQFEHGTVDLGRLEAAPDDLGRLLLAEFCLIYGNDFFFVPLTLRAGSVCRITELEVHTTYGEVVSIPPAAVHDKKKGRMGWAMFQFDGEPGVLVLPPCSVDVLDGPATADILFTRDEMANLAWAVDRASTEPPPASPPPDSVLRYRLSTPIPPAWQPLLPTQSGTLESPSGEHVLEALELPREGRRTTRHARHARGEDGAAHLWTGWRTRPGRGESSSGLRYDDLG